MRLAFLNFLLRTEPKLFLAFCCSRNFGGIKIEPKDVEIDCLKQNYGGTWDGQRFSRKKGWFIAVESKVNKSALNRAQLKGHKRNLRKLRDEFSSVELVFLTPFDKDWLVKEYLHGKHEKHIGFLSWGNVYKSTSEVQGGLTNAAHKFVTEQYQRYLEAANGNRAGIIQIVSKEYIDDDYIRNVKAGKHTRFHIPSKKVGFDVPNFKVFV